MSAAKKSLSPSPSPAESLGRGLWNCTDVLCSGWLFIRSRIDSRSDRRGVFSAGFTIVVFFTLIVTMFDLHASEQKITIKLRWELVK
ncbi:hypothetical protein TIFTF001_053941 [Ficus carica]|uniref:Uncharacterized protein n=1 Tax=Ficus carica TaxID=3494 RepID=A0AA88JHT0_FICCA|nr:hypothetical protein TIFTF001_053941 [Ficus carica]